MGYLGNVRPTIALVADDITDGAITAAKIAADAVTSAKIGADQIGSSELNLGANYAFTGTVTGAGGGKVLQVVSTTKTDTWSVASTTFTDVTGLSVTLTPASTANKILIFANLCVSSDGGNSGGRYSAIRFMRDSTAIAIGDTDGSRARITASIDSNDQQASTDIYVLRHIGASHLDSPSTTSATTYKIQAGNTNTNVVTTYVNRQADDTNANYSHRGVSTLTIMEISG